MGKLTNVESLNQGELIGRIDALEQRVAMLENELAMDRPRLSGIRQAKPIPRWARWNSAVL